MNPLRSCFSLLLASTLFLSGCSVTQVKDRFYLQTIELSHFRYPKVQLHAFASDEADYAGNGSTLHAALEDAEIPAGRELFLGHLELLCLQDTAFVGQLTELLQSYRLSSGCKVIYTTRSLESVNTEKLLENLKQEEQNGRLPETDLLTILKELSNSSGTVLLPFYLTNGFSLVLIQPNGVKGTLSNEAIQGLCWLRGENYPERVSISGEEQASDFLIENAATKLTATVDAGVPVVTVSITIQGKGDAVALRKQLETACQAAEEETVKKYRADVIGLEACLRQQCYQLYAEQDWEGILHTVTFVHEITILTE
ncbi:MAG: Ger(x)C family spore germination C-terminal domain-containing protein [Oscillospiraceae bacterium]|nr:Ger(x)C family spore germination C-terminal domain-containing protein [Oscillospiraceae bacterium]MDY2509224.1 Ger(x)C family spore germination C-terminal domain-containing protein [Ruminococcus callidus]